MQTDSIQNIIAPKVLEIETTYLKIENKFIRTLFVSSEGYPRFVSPGWLDPIVNFNHSLDVSFFIYPVEGKGVLDDMRRQIAMMEAEIATDLQRGKVINASTQAKLQDALALREQLTVGAERFFQFGFYISIYADSVDELNQVTSQVESTLGSVLITAKNPAFQTEDAFYNTLPLGVDKLSINRNMDTTSLATTFPFYSAELSSDKGILYGINEDNDSLVIFDRFSLENYNSCLFATSGAGKSFSVKLEALRSMMLGAEVFVIDPENEYKALTEAVGGEYIEFSYDSLAKINPFDLSGVNDDGSASGETPENQLGFKIGSLHALCTVIMGKLNPTEEATLDRALVATYKAKGISLDPATQTKEPPLMEDLYKTLLGMEDAVSKSLADRLEKFIKGSFKGIFDQPTNINLDNKFIVFSVQKLDVSSPLRPIAMFMIIDFIWTRVQRDLKKRLLIVDEAWHMMKYPDTANFLHSITKRARKYYLGVTTITQDVEDFLGQDIGKAIVTNSALKLLMKQSPTAIDRVAEVFKLSDGEKQLLLSADVGEGIFFAGPNHVAIRVVASDEEYKLASTKPQEKVQSLENNAPQPQVPQPTPGVIVEELK